MRSIERVIGITTGVLVLAAAPVLAAPAGRAAVVPWSTADAVAAQRVAGGGALRPDSGRGECA